MSIYMHSIFVYIIAMRSVLETDADHLKNKEVQKVSEQEARKLVAALTYEEKLRLFVFLQCLEQKRGGQPCQTKK